MLALGAVLAAAWALIVPDRSSAVRYDIPGTRLQYVVEVLNGTEIDGLARAITIRLRHAGLDVVAYGTASTPDQDSTVVLVRGADTAAGWAVRDVLGVGQVRVEPDARMLLDVTVILGRDVIR